MEQDFEFKWGAPIDFRGKSKDIRCYQSFTLQGVEYSLYDCVYFYQTGALETEIGKIIRIYSTATEKKVRVVWFFRPGEIRNFLGEYKPDWNEIFLASGNEIGVSNVNPLEAIVGKCNVVCLLKDKRNHLPSEEELRMANYIFRCTFNVDRRRILRDFPDQIYNIDVKEYFNKPKHLSHSVHTFHTHLRDQAGPSKVSSYSQSDKVVTHPVRNGKPTSKSIPIVKELKDQAGPSKVSSYSQSDKAVTHPVKNGKPSSKPIPIVKGLENWACLELKDQAGPSKVSSYSQSDKVTHPVKNGKPSSKPIPIVKGSENWARPELKDQAGQLNMPSKSQLDKPVSCPVLNGEPSSKAVPVVEVKSYPLDPFLPPVSTPDIRPLKKIKIADSRPPYIDKSGWFKTGSWDDKLRAAEGKGTLVLLHNLDPLFASSEVQSLVWTAFEQKVEARMIACTPFFDPRYGKAFVIFKSSDDAESAIFQLDRRCLTLADGRPVIGTICRGTLKQPDKTSKFLGHLIIDRHRVKSLREEMRKAVSTSHFAQPNTVEYDMAMDWCLLQEKSELWWKALYQDREEKEKEIKNMGEQKLKNLISWHGSS